MCAHHYINHTQMKDKTLSCEYIFFVWLGPELEESENIEIPLIAHLIPNGIKRGSNIIVEYDPQSQWIAIATTIVAKWVQSKRQGIYVASMRPREDVLNDLVKLGIDVTASEGANLLRVDDYYSASLGLDTSASLQEEVEGKYARLASYRVSDMSVEFLKYIKTQPAEVTRRMPGELEIIESFSIFLRYNDEKSFLDFLESRSFPFQRRIKRANLLGFVRGLHTEAFYRRLENAADGLIEIRVLEHNDEVKNFLRIQSLKGQPHDTHKHEIEIKPNGEAVLST